jgi:glyoxylase-like metal-dependent hydrolase (beta-lactamase superfamily II)
MSQSVEILTQRWKVGAVTITSVVEDEIAHIPVELFFPGGTAGEVLAQGWCIPDFADDRGNVALRVQALVVDVAGRRILVDPCVGNGKRRALPFWNDQQYPWLDRFASAGFDVGTVDVVVHTHLHADHVGWDTQFVDGAWQPTFTGARHLYTAAELEFALASVSDDEDVYGDSIAPIVAAGLADVVAPDHDLGDGLRLVPSPGHTPGHVSLVIESAGEQALISGDFVHHPVQCAYPHWAEIGDADVEAARDTRRAMFADAAARGLLFVGTHFPTHPAGRVVTDGDAFRFEPVFEATAAARA